ncbi:class I SAM-dependent methyltransferase [Rhodoferax sp.]|uniref:class I SAM-dependent methyltransferase n=1 Tax=Rhodoferax sp. TaxID=50421 RepID=UPI00374D1AC2
MHVSPLSLPAPAYVEETRFGNWFLNTPTWKTHVLCRALDDLQTLLPPGAGPFESIVDVGCGFGHSFAELARRFHPRQIIGLDAAPELQQRTAEAVASCVSPVQLLECHAAAIALPEASVDMVFCHQTFHHIVEQEAALAEFFRVLKPGGCLLFAESTRYYIHSLPIKLLFRHPMDVQRTADEYLAQLRSAGFAFERSNISLPYLWWSRPDLGFFEWLGRPVPTQRNETMVNLVARKPQV